jgi:hypothetical protein
MRPLSSLSTACCQGFARCGPVLDYCWRGVMPDLSSELAPPRVWRS